MKRKKIDEGKNSRRSFLKNFTVTVGLGALMSGTGFAFSAYAKESEKKLKLKLLTQDGKLVEVSSKNIKPVKTKESHNLIKSKGRKGITGKKFVMVIDLANCKNDRSCIKKCQSVHQLKPEQYHINTHQMQDSEHTAKYHMPKNCFQCDNPPCTKVCPVGATFKREDGLVLIDNKRCIGCRFCMAACPYSARSFNWADPINAEKYSNIEYDMELNVPQKRGTVTKCTFSADKLRKKELPYCVKACPNGVFWFGDLNEDAVTNGTTGKTVRFTTLIKDNAGYRYLEELNTKPNVYYLPPKNRIYPFDNHEKEK